jgi:hypothetical protein
VLASFDESVPVQSRALIGGKKHNLGVVCDAWLHHCAVLTACVLLYVCAQELCLPYDLCAADLDEAEPLGMLLLVCYLFTALPQLLPRATLDFSCKLGDRQVRANTQHCLQFLLPARPHLHRFQPTTVFHPAHRLQLTSCVFYLAPVQVREIQLSNPTRRALSYAARLEGAADFSLEASLVKIDPGQSTQVCTYLYTSPALGDRFILLAL